MPEWGEISKGVQSDFLSKEGIFVINLPFKWKIEAGRLRRERDSSRFSARDI